MTKKDSEDRKKLADMEKEAENLRQKIAELEKEKQTLTDQIQRIGADYANYQKRSVKQIAESVAYEKKMILRSLLPSLDNFEHAFAGSQAADGEEGLQKVIEGVHLVYQHMLDALKAHGVEKIETIGRPFDPTLHEAMMQRTDESKENNLVLEEFQPGYTLNSQVLRPARVIVNTLPEAPESPAAAEPAEEQPPAEESQE